MAYGQVLQSFHLGGHRHASQFFQFLTAGKGVLALRRIRTGNTAQHIGRELVRAGGGQQHGRRSVVRCQPVLTEHMAAHGGMRIHQVMILVEPFPDLDQRILVVRAVSPENIRQPVPALFADGIASAFLQLFHPLPDEVSIPVRCFIQQPFQVGGNQDVHAGAQRLEERPVGGINAAVEEISQHVIPVAGTDQFVHRQSHVPGIITRQDIAEVSGRNTEVHGISRRDGVLVDQVRVGGEVIDDLRSKPSEVDGVCGGQRLAPVIHLLHKVLGGKKLLHTGLGVVKIALYSDYMRVVSPGGHHLQPLYVADAFLRIKYGAARTGHVPESFQRRFTGISACSHQDADLPFFAVFHSRKTGQVRQKLERHVFKGQRRSVEKFQHPGRVVNLFDRRNLRRVKTFCIVGRAYRVLDLRNSEILQVAFQDGHCPGGIVHFAERGNPVHRNRREHGGDIQSAVGRKAVQNRLAGRYAAFTAGGEERHE